MTTSTIPERLPLSIQKYCAEVTPVQTEKICATMHKNTHEKQVLCGRKNQVQCLHASSVLYNWVLCEQLKNQKSTESNLYKDSKVTLSATVFNAHNIKELRDHHCHKIKRLCLFATELDRDRPKSVHSSTRRCSTSGYCVGQAANQIDGRRTGPQSSCTH